MATQLNNEKRFLIIHMTWREYVAASDKFGWCDLCSTDDFEHGGYYIPVIDQWYCEKCYKAWYDTAAHYKVDMEEERYRFNEMRNKLKGLGVWNEEPKL